MTGADLTAIASSGPFLPRLASCGVIASWTGAVSDSSKHVEVTTPERAGSMAQTFSDEPVILILGETPQGPVKVLPWSAITEVVFSNECSVREFSARVYDNFDPSGLHITNDASLFTGTPIDSICIGEAPGNRESIDRIVGAAATAHAVAVPASAKAAATIRDQMTNLLLDSTPQMTNLLLDSTPNANGALQLIDALKPLLTEHESEDDLLTDIVTRVARLDPVAALGNRRFVEEVIESRAASDDTVENSLHAVLELMAGTRELPSLRYDKGLRSVKALALFLLRADPRNTIGWAELMDQDPLSVVVAATLAGARSGWTRLPSGLRGDATSKLKFEAVIADSLEPERSWKWDSDLGPIQGAIGEPRSADGDPPTGPQLRHPETPVDAIADTEPDTPEEEAPPDTETQKTNTEQLLLDFGDLSA